MTNININDARTAFYVARVYVARASLRQALQDALKAEGEALAIYVEAQKAAGRRFPGARDRTTGHG